MDVVGEVYYLLSWGKHTFILDALVVNKLVVEVLAEIPFMTIKDVATYPAKCQIVIEGYRSQTVADNVCTLELRLPDQCLTPEMRDRFTTLHLQHVFKPGISNTNGNICNI